MDIAARVHSLEQQSRELSATYEGILHRIKRLREETHDLVHLRDELRQARTRVEEREAHLARVKQALPRVARKEELERFSRRLDAMPFEKFVLSPEMSDVRGEDDGTQRY